MIAVTMLAVLFGFLLVGCEDQPDADNKLIIDGDNNTVYFVYNSSGERVTAEIIIQGSGNELYYVKDGPSGEVSAILTAEQAVELLEGTATVGTGGH